MKSPGSSNSSRSAELWGNQEVQDRAGGEQHKSETQKRKSRLSRIRLLGARLVALLPDDGDCCRVVEHRRRGGGDRAQTQGGDDTHGLAPNRHWCLSKYCSHAAERILAACSMLP